MKAKKERKEQGTRKKACFFLLSSLFFLLCSSHPVPSTQHPAPIDVCNVIWDSQSQNSSESMPCGGGDIGLNVWVEDDDVFFYMSQSGAFDEHNMLLKQGRIRIELTPNPFSGGTFSQELCLDEGCIYIRSKNDRLSVAAKIWVDVFSPVIMVEISSDKEVSAKVHYESWRYEDRLLRPGESNQNSYKWTAPKDLYTAKDEVMFDADRIVFYHWNKEETVFDVAVRQQGLDEVKHRMYNPLAQRVSGGIVEGENLVPAGTGEGVYGDTDYRWWALETKQPSRQTAFSIKLNTSQQEDISLWLNEIKKPVSADSSRNKAWWAAFWDRSFIRIDDKTGEGKGNGVSRNYQLFRYMLACNAYGDWPTKFNGGLFTFDPSYVDSLSRFTPDFRKWGGGTHTAQNQRLVYFSMLKSGDWDMMTPQFEFYQRMLATAELRSQTYWNHAGACFTEQTENFGLPNPAEYGRERPEGFDPGLEYNAWLEYQWDTVLEFCFMILEKERYTGEDISGYLPLIESCLVFFDEHYQYLARQRGRKALDGNGKLVLYPGSACETYKMAYNAASTIAALQVTTSRLLELPARYLDEEKRAYYTGLLGRLPGIETRVIDNREMIAPARLWERINNVETPQLYPVYPWGIYGIGKPGIEVAINTYEHDSDAIRFRSHVGWKQDAIWAARLGLTEEAKELTVKKLEDSGRRFPAFWGPGFDWAPDHNWGGSGMIALQEMLLQTDGERIILFPAWPDEWDVHFKLRAPYNTTIECKREGGIITLLNVSPEERRESVSFGK